MPKEIIGLVEEVGMAIEERADLSPLAARIYAALILSSEEGLTFDEIVAWHQASKSSVSNNLNVLIKLKYVEFYTKHGDRRRYFRTSKFYVKSAMEKYHEHFEKELDVLEKINAFNKKHNPEKFRNEKSVGTLYQEYLTDLNEGFKNKIKEIEQFENQD
ncbi:hypothetical protein RQM65_01650 [Pricia sp. S334]|uniref:Transcriptional regulator n=1 Tax=Pricia mediterranea TaxID=3076079 RepID=A0ABU3L2Q6_9FLAO|nr:hypothetical protein [Pricia sp. S334]MDT7827367.1 hypothetical protein [Pricia sp. S334]